MGRSSFLTLVASLVIAILLRLALSPLFEPGREREFSAPLEIANLPDSLTVVQAPAVVALVASGTIEDLDGYDTREVKAVIDLTSAKVGVDTYAIGVRGPNGSRIVVKPRYGRVTLEIQRLAEATRKVEVLTTGLAPVDLLVDGATIEPATVKIAGPEELLKLASTARVTLDLATVRPNSPQTLAVEVLSRTGRPLPLLRSNPASVTVVPAVAAAPRTKRVPVMLTWKGRPPPGLVLASAELRPSQVTVSGDSAALARFAAIETEPISMEGFTGDRNLSVRFRVPPGVVIEGIDEVQVSLRFKGALTR